MAMNIEFIKSALKQPARPTLFDVEISGNPAVQILSSDVLKFTCKSAGLPSVSLGKIDVPYYGRKVPYAGDRTYEDWNTTIVMNNDWTIFRELQKWHAAYNHPEMNVATTANMVSYKCDGYVNVYDPTGLSNMRIKMVGLFPYQIAQLDLSWENTDSTADLQVTWFLDYWHVVN